MHVGCMIEPLAVAYNGLFVRGEGFRPGHNIATFGAGPIGLSAVALAVGAKIVQIGISSRKAPLTTVKLQNVGGSYHGNIGSAGHGIWKGCINLIATGRVDPKKYTNPCIFSMDEALLAIEDAAKAGGGKNVVDPSM